MANTLQEDQSGASGTTSAAASTLVEKAGEVRSVASVEAREVARDAKYHARLVAHESRESFRSEASNQAARLATTLRDIGGQLQSMAESQMGGGTAVDMSRQLAGGATRLADKLETGGVDATLADVKSFARRRPGVFLAAALGAGFVAGRLLKAADTQSLMEAAKEPSNGPRALPSSVDLREVTP